MKLIPKLIPSLTVPVLSVVLAPFTLAQTSVWYQEVVSLDYERTIDLATDSVGNVFEARYSSVDLFTAGVAQLFRYTPAGELAWTVTIDSGVANVPRGVASDGADGAYIAGDTTGDLAGQNAGSFDAWVAHYNGQGQLGWIRQFGGAASDLARAAAPDGAGGVFVAGTTGGSLGGQNAGSGDVWVARYDAAGNQLWITQFGSAANDDVTSMTLDSAGGAVLCGETRGALAGPSTSSIDAWIVRLDPTGGVTWSDQLGVPGIDRAEGVSSDQLGGVFVGGSTRFGLAGPSAGESDVWIAHYDATGNQTWLRQIGTAADDTCWTAASDGAGGAFIGGRTDGSLGGGGSSDGSNWLGHYDAAGNEIGFIQFGASNSEGLDVSAPNRRGGVYLGGEVLAPGSSGLQGLNPWIARYDDILIETYCSPAVMNSTGTDGKMSASGSSDIALGEVVLRADDLPPNAFGYFLNSSSRDFIISAGNPAILCLGSPVGRFVGPGQVLNSGSAGTFSLPIDLAAIPQPTGTVAVQPGETWHFQAWHRDAVGGAATWNFTDGLSVMFR